MDSNIVGIANPNYFLPEGESRAAVNVDEPRTKDASTMAPSRPSTPPVMEDPQYELYQAPTSGSCKQGISKILNKLQIKSASPITEVKAEVPAGLVKRQTFVYSATSTFFNKLTSWMDRHKKTEPPPVQQEVDTQTEASSQDSGPPFEDVPL